MKKLILSLVIVLSLISCKKEENNSNGIPAGTSIVGEWRITQVGGVHYNKNNGFIIEFTKEGKEYESNSPVGNFTIKDDLYDFFSFPQGLNYPCIYELSNNNNTLTFRKIGYKIEYPNGGEEQDILVRIK